MSLSRVVLIFLVDEACLAEIVLRYATSRSLDRLIGRSEIMELIHVFEFWQSRLPHETMLAGEL